MKFKMKAILLMGSCLLLSASQLQAVEGLKQEEKKATVEFFCTPAMFTDEQKYLPEARQDGGSNELTKLACEETNNTHPQLLTTSVAAGEYTLGGTILPNKWAKGKLCDETKNVHFEEEKTYEISFVIDDSSNTCTVSAQEK
jgi:hypothetical protein